MRDSSSWLLVVLLCLGLMATACSANNTVVPPDAAAVNQDDEYRLGIGDMLRVTVLGHGNLSGEFAVNSGGRVALPLVGDVPAAGRTVDDVERMIVEGLSPEYLKNPTVSVEVIQHQNCYTVFGYFAFLNRGCRCAPEMRVNDLFKKCGGFTYRSVENKFVLLRDGKTISIIGGPETLVFPGDVIEIGGRERFY